MMNRSGSEVTEEDTSVYRGMHYAASPRFTSSFWH